MEKREEHHEADPGRETVYLSWLDTESFTPEAERTRVPLERLGTGLLAELLARMREQLAGADSRTDGELLSAREERWRTLALDISVPSEAKRRSLIGILTSRDRYRLTSLPDLAALPLSSPGGPIANPIAIVLCPCGGGKGRRSFVPSACPVRVLELAWSAMVSVPEPEDDEEEQDEEDEYELEELDASARSWLLPALYWMNENLTAEGARIANIRVLEGEHRLSLTLLVRHRALAEKSLTAVAGWLCDAGDGYNIVFPDPRAPDTTTQSRLFLSRVE